MNTRYVVVLWDLRAPRETFRCDGYYASAEDAHGVVAFARQERGADGMVLACVEDTPPRIPRALAEWPASMPRRTEAA